MGESGGEAGLSVSEGVLLGHALVARVAEDLGVRVFFIKGPASVQLGLRRPKISNDVDVFVAPADLELLLDGLRERGWRERPEDPESIAFPKHSVTIHHPEWPCCIDVHFRFPGMDHAAGEAFDAMWSQRKVTVLAGQKVFVPSKPLGILILALHALRTPKSCDSQDELHFLAQVIDGESLQAFVIEVAASTGALGAVRPFLEVLLVSDPVSAWPEPSLEWRWRQITQEPGGAPLVAVLRASWLQRPKLLWQAAFPRPEALLSRNIYAEMSFKGRSRQHLFRWLRFLNSIPQIVRDYRSAGWRSI